MYLLINSEPQLRSTKPYMFSRQYWMRQILQTCNISRTHVNVCVQFKENWIKCTTDSWRWKMLLKESRWLAYDLKCYCWKAIGAVHLTCTKVSYNNEIHLRNNSMPKKINGWRSLICSRRNISKSQSKQCCSKSLIFERPLPLSGNKTEAWRFVARTTESFELRRDDWVFEGPC